VGVQVSESGVGVINASSHPYLLHYVVDDAGRERLVLVGDEQRPLRASTAVVHEVREKLLVNDGDDAGLISLARTDLDSLPVKVDVSDIQVNELLPAEAEPIQRFEDTAVAKVGGGNKEFSDLGGLQVVGRGCHLLFHKSLHY